MLPEHHPGAEMLLDYAAGNVPEPVGLLLATHLALCPRCRRETAVYEQAGGLLLEQVRDDQEPAAAEWQALLTRLEVPAEAVAEPTPRRAGDLPRPLADYLGRDLDDLNWRRVGHGIAAFDVLPARRGPRAVLVRIPYGVAVPEHGHGGTEATLVLHGGYADTIGRFRRGDLQLADGTLRHGPRADLGEDCLCLAVIEGDLRFSSLVARWVGRFVRL